MIFCFILSQTPSIEDMKRKFESWLSIQTHDANTSASEGLNHFVIFHWKCLVSPLEVFGLSIRCRSVWIARQVAGIRVLKGKAQSSAFHQREGEISCIHSNVLVGPNAGLPGIPGLVIPEFCLGHKTSSTVLLPVVNILPPGQTIQVHCCLHLRRSLGACAFGQTPLL